MKSKCDKIKEIEEKIKNGEMLTEGEAKMYRKETTPPVPNEKKAKSRFYKLNSILGIPAVFRVLIGPRMCGKSYSVTERICKLKKEMGADCKAYWMRVSETSTKAMLANKAAKLVDPDLVRKYDLDLTTKGMTVFNHGEPFLECIPLSAAAKMKGVAFFDKDFKGKYIIVLDEFIVDANAEKRTSFDPCYNFICMVENIARTTKDNIEVWLCANNVQESAGILSRCFNFIPQKTGRFKLRSKRCVIDVIPATEEYKKDRKGSLADILGGDDNNFTDSYERDISLIYKGPVHKPTAIIKFTKAKNDWFVVWDGNIIRPYKGENVDVVAMRPYLDSLYNKELALSIIERYDARAFHFSCLSVQVCFTECLSKLRK